MGAPTLRNTVSKRSLINATPAPARGFAPPENDEMIVIVMVVPPACAGAETVVAGLATVAGGGAVVVTELLDPAPVFGRNISTSQVSLTGANVTLLPLIPVTSRPLIVVPP